MLANLFKDISIASLGRAVGFTILSLLVAIFFLRPLSPTMSFLQLQWQVAPALYFSLMVLVVVGSGWWLNQSINAISFLKNDFQLLPIFGLVFTAVVTQDPRVEYLLLLPVGVFLLLRLLSLTRGAPHTYVLFDAGVITGLMALFVPESLVFVVIAWLAILNFGAVYFRAFLMPVMGVCAVWFMLFSYFYLAHGYGLAYQWEVVFGELEMQLDLNEWGEQSWRYLPLLALMLPAFYQTLQVYSKANVLKKQAFSFMLLMLLILFAAGLLIEDNLRLYLWLTIPVSVLLSNLIHYSRKWWQKDLVYLGLILFLIFRFL